MWYEIKSLINKTDAVTKSRIFNEIHRVIKFESNLVAVSIGVCVIQSL